MKTISLIAATFLTLALSGPAVNAGRVPFNGTWETNEVVTPFGDPPIGFFTNGQGTLTSTELGPLALYFTALLDVDFVNGVAVGVTRLIDANGDSIFTCGTGHLVTLDPFHITETHTVTGGTGRYAGARGSFAVDRTVDLSTGDSSGTFNGVIIVRGDH